MSYADDLAAINYAAMLNDLFGTGGGHRLSPDAFAVLDLGDPGPSPRINRANDPFAALDLSDPSGPPLGPPMPRTGPLPQSRPQAPVSPQPPQLSNGGAPPPYVDPGPQYVDQPPPDRVPGGLGPQTDDQTLRLRQQLSDWNYWPPEQGGPAPRQQQPADQQYYQPDFSINPY